MVMLSILVNTCVLSKFHLKKTKRKELWYIRGRKVYTQNQLKTSMHFAGAFWVRFHFLIDSLIDLEQYFQAHKLCELGESLGVIGEGAWPSVNDFFYTYIYIYTYRYCQHFSYVYSLASTGTLSCLASFFCSAKMLYYNILYLSYTYKVMNTAASSATGKRSAEVEGAKETSCP